MKSRILIASVVLSILSGFVASKVAAQSGREFSSIRTLYATAKKTDYKQYANKNRNQLEATFSLLFLGYKTFVSSQDMDACVFQPSCSVYAIECIRHERNKVKAFLAISDRLMRCHPLVDRKSYHIDSYSGKYLDPVEK